MNTFVILSEKSWHEKLADILANELPDFKWVRIYTKEDFTVENLDKLGVDKIFIPHWSYIIPEEIYLRFDCVVFHMTDLPYGRGGSPLQNLIARGFHETKISAIKVEKGIDTGPVFLKKDLSLSGTANEIFIRSVDIIQDMIIEIVLNNLNAHPQIGEVTKFKRRKPEDGNLENLDDLGKIYNFIRMLDGEGYPNAFIDLKNVRLEFSRAAITSEKEILADVKIIKKEI